MKMKSWAKFGAVSAMLLSGYTHAALVLGQNYTVLAKPIPQTQPSKIEVLEFFGYFCVHCYHFDPVLLKRAQAFPKDVYLRTSHVVWQPDMLGLARVAAAVDNASLKYQSDQAIFKAVYEQKIDLSDSATFKQWAIAQKDFDSKKLMAAYDAPATLVQAKQMQALTETYRIDSTPTVIVGGKYQVKFRSDNWAEGMITVDELIAKVRSERQAKVVRKQSLLKSRGATFAKTANQ